MIVKVGIAAKSKLREMFERIKKRWNYKADPYDEDMFLSKEWFSTMLYGIGFLLVIALLYLIANWLLEDYVADRLFDFLLFGIIIFMVAFAWGLEKGK